MSAGTQELRRAEVTLRIEGENGMRIEVVATVDETKLQRILDIISEESDGRES